MDDDAARDVNFAFVLKKIGTRLPRTNLLTRGTILCPIFTSSTRFRFIGTGKQSDTIENSENWPRQPRFGLCSASALFSDAPGYLIRDTRALAAPHPIFLVFLASPMSAHPVAAPLGARPTAALRRRVRHDPARDLPVVVCSSFVLPLIRLGRRHDFATTSG